MEANHLWNKSIVPEPVRYSHVTTTAYLSKLLQLEYDHNMQDWDLELADAKRLNEFCDLYESATLSRDHESRFALMELIIASCDDDLNSGPKEKSERDALIDIATRVYHFLCQEFVLHIHTINYWRLPKEGDITNVFKVTPFMRKVWGDCYVSEFAHFLDEDETEDSSM